MTGRLAVMLLATMVTKTIAQAPERLVLLRCLPGNAAPCLRARVGLAAVERGVAAGRDSGETDAWSATLGGVPLEASAAAPVASPGRARLLIALDRGAAMSGDATAFVRVGLKAWLTTLDSATVSIAVAPFDDHITTAAIDAAQFATPSQAIAAIDTIAAPSAGWRSPLYSAAAAGAALLRRTSGHGDRDAGMLLITAGRNDVEGVRADTGLLGGAAGLATASARVDAADERVWMLALGSGEPPAELRSVAGRDGSVREVAVDPNAIVAGLVAIQREFADRRELTFGLGASGVASLARVAATGEVVLRGDSGHVIRWVAWRPPLMAMPAFQGTVDSTALSPALREALLFGATPDTRLPVAVLLLFTVATLWVAVTWSIRQRQQGSPGASSARAAATLTGLASGAPAEARPRRPEDITKQTARRTAMHR